MNGIYMPVTNKIISSDGESLKETYLENKAAYYLNIASGIYELDLSLPGRRMPAFQYYVEGTDGTRIYRIGNICIMNIYLNNVNGTNGEYVPIYQLPWKPYYNVADDHNDGKFTSSSIVSWDGVKFVVESNSGQVKMNVFSLHPAGAYLSSITGNIIFPLKEQI